MSGFESPGGTSSVTRMVGWVLGSLLLSMFLVSGKLVEIAERQPLGDSRDRWIDVAEGVDRASNFLAMNRPYDLITDIRGVGTDAGEQVDTIEEVAAALGGEREPSQTPGPAPTIAVRPRPTATAPPGGNTRGTYRDRRSLGLRSDGRRRANPGSRCR